MRKVVSVALAVVAAAALWVTPALADGPGVGTASVVSVGDSAISGEAGRWAGNTNGSPSNVDALGSTAYYDAGSSEAIHGCHRSKASEIGILTASANLACSGARTSTQPFSSANDFKPGLDFYDDGAGHIGQARALQQYAATHNVKMVVALIGANDYGFADIVQQCVLDWLTSPSWWKNYCHDDSSMTSKFTAANVAAITTRVANAFLNLRTAMRNAGYADASWKLLAQTYSSPLPRGAQIRYSQSGFTRQDVGGCGVWNADADWANDTVVTTLNATVRNAAAATGIAFPALVTLAMSGATPADSGLASGLVNTTQQVGGALGLAVLATLSTSRSNHLLADGESAASALTGGYHLAFAIGAGLVIAAIVVAALVLRSERVALQEVPAGDGATEEIAYSEAA